VVWTRNNEKLKNQGRYLIDVFDTKASVFILVLEIDNITPEDAGTYKCTAKNHKGENSVNVEVKLDGNYFFANSFYRLKKYLNNCLLFFRRQERQS
jgi:hypothetical protein